MDHRSWKAEGSRMIYSHSQSSPMKWFVAVPVLALTAAAGIFFAGGLAALGPTLVAAGLIALLTLVFTRLTVDIAPPHVRVAFGAGWPSRQIELVDVTSVRRVRNRWWMGWGIRWIPRGRLWNVWGLDAVELELATGRRFRIGTDDPEGLMEALQRVGVS